MGSSVSGRNDAAGCGFRAEDHASGRVLRSLGGWHLSYQRRNGRRTARACWPGPRTARSRSAPRATAWSSLCTSRADEALKPIQVAMAPEAEKPAAVPTPPAAPPKPKRVTVRGAAGRGRASRDRAAADSGPSSGIAGMDVAARSGSAGDPRRSRRNRSCRRLHRPSPSRRKPSSACRRCRRRRNSSTTRSRKPTPPSAR